MMGAGGRARGAVGRSGVAGTREMWSESRSVWTIRISALTPLPLCRWLPVPERQRRECFCRWCRRLHSVRPPEDKGLEGRQRSEHIGHRQQSKERGQDAGLMRRAGRAMRLPGRPAPRRRRGCMGAEPGTGRSAQQAAGVHGAGVHGGKAGDGALPCDHAGRGEEMAKIRHRESMGHDAMVGMMDDK